MTRTGNQHRDAALDRARTEPRPARAAGVGRGGDPADVPKALPPCPTSAAGFAGFGLCDLPPVFREIAEEWRENAEDAVTNELRGSPRGRAGRNLVSAQTTCSDAGASDGASASEAFSAREEWVRRMARVYTAPKGQSREREAELRQHVRAMLEQGL